MELNIVQKNNNEIIGKKLLTYGQFFNTLLHDCECCNKQHQFFHPSSILKGQIVGYHTQQTSERKQLFIVTILI